MGPQAAGAHTGVARYRIGPVVWSGRVLFFVLRSASCQTPTQVHSTRIMHQYLKIFSWENHGLAVDTVETDNLAQGAQAY